MSYPKGNRQKDRMDYRKELREIIKLVDTAKLRLGSVSCEMDADDLYTIAVEEAMDALDDVIDILEDAVDEEQWEFSDEDHGQRLPGG